MADASTNWILSNVRQGWENFEATVPAAYHATDQDTEENFRTPVIYIDRYKDYAGASGGVQYHPPWNYLYSTAIQALVGSEVWQLPPCPSYDDREWFCHIIDRVIEHDSEGKNSIVRITESWKGTAKYYQVYSTKFGYWVSLTEEQADLIFPNPPVLP